MQITSTYIKALDLAEPLTEYYEHMAIPGFCINLHLIPKNELSVDLTHMADQVLPSSLSPEYY